MLKVPKSYLWAVSVGVRDTQRFVDGNCPNTLGQQPQCTPIIERLSVEFEVICGG